VVEVVGAPDVESALLVPAVPPLEDVDSTEVVGFSVTAGVEASVGGALVEASVEPPVGAPVDASVEAPVGADVLTVGPDTSAMN
jgi:hypothetical protein